MSSPITFPQELMLNIEKQVQIKASREIVFETIISQSAMQHTPNGEDLNLKLEAYPGGRWYRDLGNGAGHFWGHVQVIKPPVLLEICGPMFMSYPVMSHVQYKLTEENGVTTLSLKHRAVGLIPDDHRKNVTTGWQLILDSIKDKSQK